MEKAIVRHYKRVKEMKRVLAFLLTMILIFAGIPFGVVPVSALEQKESDYTYTVSSGTATITGYTGTASEIIIPDTLGGYPVTVIGEFAFGYCDNLKTLVIGDDVIAIETMAFLGCSNLAKVTIGYNVAQVGDSAFLACINLTDVHYHGSEERKNSITIEAGNESLCDATWRYEAEYVPECKHIYADGICTLCGDYAIPDGAKTMYRFREKKFKYSREELADPWILYDVTQEEDHKDHTYVFPLDAYEYTKEEAREWALKKSTLCFHSYEPIQYNRYRTSSGGYVYSQSADSSLGTWEGKSWGFFVCMKKVPYTKYHYYQWGEWSEWSETAVKESDDVQVELKYVTTITYNANGGTGAPETIIKDLGETVTLSLVVPTKEYHRFRGWATTADGPVEYHVGSKYSANENLTLYAVWQCTHTYSNACDDTCDLCSATRVPSEHTVKIEDTVFSYEGNLTLVDGEYVKENTGGGNYARATLTVLKDVTLTIHYQVRITEIDRTKFTIKHNENVLVERTSTTTQYNSVDYHTITISASAGDTIILFLDTWDLAEGTEDLYVSVDPVYVYVSPDSVEPTCTESVYCAECNAVLKEALGHTYTTEITKQPACYSSGTAIHTCSACGHSYTEKIPSGHNWNDATCTQAKTCSVCGIVSGSALGHAYDDEYDAVCNMCSAIREAKIPVIFGGNSISEDVSGLAFCFDAEVEGMTITGTTANYENATVNGYKLISMGALVTNGITDTDIAAVYLYSLVDTTASYAVRIIEIPASMYHVTVTATPYIIVEIDGQQVTLYGEAQECSYDGCAQG